MDFAAWIAPRLGDQRALIVSRGVEPEVSKRSP
jgi:hypothetical protein